MADDGNLIPITDEQAKLGQEIVKAFSGMGAFVEKALGSTPSDLIGYLGGDWLRFKRAENIAKMMNLAKDTLEKSSVIDQEPASLSVALPILRFAADESREEIQELWARLLAAAMDPTRAGSVRQSFTESISKMDPLDAIVLLNHIAFKDVMWSVPAEKMGISRDQLEISISNLYRLKLLSNNSLLDIQLAPFGREFLRVVLGTPVDTPRMVLKP